MYRTFSVRRFHTPRLFAVALPSYRVPAVVLRAPKELFKKTLPSAGSSFMQVQVTSTEMRQRALHAMKTSRKGDPRLDLIELAMHGGKMGVLDGKLWEPFSEKIFASS